MAGSYGRFTFCNGSESMTVSANLDNRWVRGCIGNRRLCVCRCACCSCYLFSYRDSRQIACISRSPCNSRYRTNMHFRRCSDGFIGCAICRRESQVYGHLVTTRSNRLSRLIDSPLSGNSHCGSVTQICFYYTRSYLTVTDLVTISNRRYCRSSGNIRNDLICMTFDCDSFVAYF